MTHAEIAELAEAPKRDFRPWHAASVVQPQFNIGVPAQVIGYKVPSGYSLVITEVESWVSNAYLGATPGALNQTEQAINWGAFFAFWQENTRDLNARTTHYLALSRTRQLWVFGSGNCARFQLLSGNVINPAQLAFSFRFSGFLTLPEHAQRLKPLQSVVPSAVELQCP